MTGPQVTMTLTPLKWTATAHVLHVGSIIQMLLKTNLVRQDLLCHFKVILNVQKPVFGKTGKTNILCQSNLAWAFMQWLFPSPPLVYMTSHSLS